MSCCYCLLLRKGLPDTLSDTPTLSEDARGMKPHTFNVTMVMVSMVSYVGNV